MATESNRLTPWQRSGRADYIGDILAQRDALLARPISHMPSGFAEQEDEFDREAYYESDLYTMPVFIDAARTLYGYAKDEDRQQLPDFESDREVDE